MIRRHGCLLVILSCVGAVSLYSQEKNILAVPSIKATTVSKNEASVIRNYVETALIKTGKFMVVSYSDIEEILDAQEFSVSDCTDESCAVQIGKLLAADKIVIGELTGMGSGYVLMLRLVDVTTGRSLNAEIIEIKSVSDMEKQSFSASYRLAGMTYEGQGELPGTTGDLYVTAPKGRTLTVTVDGLEKGKTPVLVSGLSSGTHRVEASDASDPSYRYSKNVVVKNNEILEVSADLSLLKGNLFLDILPPEADQLVIFLGDTAVSKGLTKDLPAGKHVLRITGTGIFHEQGVSIASDETLRLTVTLKIGGQFTATFPPGAKATLSNGTVSIALESGVKTVVEPGRYVLSVTHPDYDPVTQTVSIGKRAAVAAEPEMKHSAAYNERIAIEAEAKRISEEKERERLETERKIAQLRAEQARTRASNKAFVVTGIISLGVSVAAGVCGGVFEYLIGQQKQKISDDYAKYLGVSLSNRTAAAWNEVEAGKTLLEQYRLYRNISFIGCGALALLSPVLFLAQSPDTAIDEQIKKIEEGSK